jgi:hypothetical protein
MGFEYKLRFVAPAAGAVAAILRGLPTARELSTPVHSFELRTKASDEGMPDADVRVEPDGAYFCDYGGAGQKFLGIVVARLVSEFGAVTITELE